MRHGALHLVMTDVPDLVRFGVVAPFCNSDHSSLLAVISRAQAVLNLCVRRKVFLKHTSLLDYHLWCNTGHALA